MTKNRLSDLNDHLFIALERLNDDALSPEEIDREINRARAVSSAANQVIASGNLALSAMKFNDERLDADSKLPRLLGGGE